MTTKELVKDLRVNIDKMPADAKKVFQAIENATEGFETAMRTKVSIGSKTATPKDFLSLLHTKFMTDAHKKAVEKTSTDKPTSRNIIERLTKNIQKETGLSYLKSKAAAKKIIKQRGLFKGRTAVGIKKDAKQPAKKFGKRISKKGHKNQYGATDGGNVYYEHRSNRADVPVDPKYPKLERGGIIEGGAPKIYIVSLKDYNQKRNEGTWLDMSSFNDGNEVNEAISIFLDSVDKKHARNEGWADEYAVHDFQNFPKEFFKNDMNTKDFNSLINFLESAKGNKLPLEVIKKYADFKDEKLTTIENGLDQAYQGSSDSTENFTKTYVKSKGMPSNAKEYMDISALGIDIRKGLPKAEFDAAEDDTDIDLAENYIAETYGDKIPLKTIETYFNLNQYWEMELSDKFDVIEHQQLFYFFQN